MIKIKDIKKIKTYEDLEAAQIGRIRCDIYHRGGGIGFYASDLAKLLDISEDQLPRFFGAGCNYLGGGLRGSIFPSTFAPSVTGRAKKTLEAIAKACCRVYESIENESGLNEEEGPDGTNWDAVGTKASRRAGVRSAY